MPLYDYRCVSCGDFREFRPMAASGTAVECPACGSPSDRVLATPFLAGKEPGAGAGQGPHGQSGFRHACGFGCTHSHGH
jgi:putative FmdB family regulatory protein